MLTTAEKILEAAGRGDMVPAHERRHVVAFLMATRPEVTDAEIGEMFKVSDRTIRSDKFKIRQEKSRRIKEEDVSLIIADILLDFERTVSDIERSKKKASLGTANFLNHCATVMDIRLKTTKALQELGYLPKNLGHLAVSKFNYVSTVGEGGVVETIKADSLPVKEANVEDAPPESRLLMGADLTEVIKEPDYLKQEQCDDGDS